MPDTFERLKAALADRYAIERELGSGGMAIVYLAQDLKHHRPVAVKVLRPELAAALGAERFLREIEIAARLSHPHILPLYDSGEADGFLYFVMPYVEGESLRQRLDREKQLALGEALRIAREVADGLGYAHSYGVIHRDIKPENVLLSGDHAVIADFGIARAITAAGGDRLTQTGLLVGTPAYMSPEQASGSSDLDGRSDLYSLGCVLYEMLAGEPPHTGPTAQAIIAKRLSEAVPLLHNVRETIPDDTERAVARALAKVPADRYATATEFAEAIRMPSAGPAWVAQRTGPLRVVGLYLLSSLAVLGAVQLLVGQLGLPGWVVPGAVVLLLLGLPIILGTALVQRGSLGAPRLASHLLTWRRAILGGVLAFGVWGVVVTVYVLVGASGSGGSTRAEGETSAVPAIAVLPFRVVGADLELWREGMVDLLSTNLEGIAGLRKIDPSVVLSRWRAAIGERTEPGDPEAALRVARQVGASYAVTGSVVGLERAVRLAAEVHDLGTGELRGSAQVDGSPDSVLALVDRLSVEVLRAGLVPADVELPQVDLSRVTTHSLPALKAYLGGEQKYRRSRWTEAIESFRRAVEMDSTFALALYRLALSYGWEGSASLASVYSERAGRLADRLPEREALLLRGNQEFSEGRLAAVHTLRTLTTRYPDDVEGWTQLGEAYLHIGGLGLYPLDLYRAAFRRSIELNPYFGPAYVHLIEDAFFREDSAGTSELLDGFRRIDAETPVCGSFETGYALVWGDSATRNQTLAALDALSATQFACLTASLPLSPAVFERIIRVFRAQLDSRNPVSTRQAAARTLRIATTKTGRLREAREVLSEIWLDDRPRAARLYVWLHLTGYPDTATARYATEILTADPEPRNAFWLGVLAVHEERWGDVERHIQALEESAPAAEFQGDSVRAAHRRAVAQALAGYAALRRGSHRKAVPQLEAVLPTLPAFGAGASEQDYLRYELGKLMLELGNLRKAQRYFESFAASTVAHLTPVEFFLGQIYEALGETEAAKLHYSRFVHLWEDCDPELRPWWEEGREALIRLTREAVGPTSSK